MERRGRPSVAIHPRGKGQGRKSDVSCLRIFFFLLIDRYRAFLERQAMEKSRRFQIATVFRFCAAFFSRKSDKAWKVSQVPRGTEEELRGDNDAPHPPTPSHRATCNQTDYERTGEPLLLFIHKVKRSSNRPPLVWEACTDTRSDTFVDCQFRSSVALPYIDIGLRIEKLIQNHFRSSTVEVFFRVFFLFTIDVFFLSFSNERIYFSVDFYSLVSCFIEKYST